MDLYYTNAPDTQVGIFFHCKFLIFVSYKQSIDKQTFIHPKFVSSSTHKTDDNIMNYIYYFYL